MNKTPENKPEESMMQQYLLGQLSETEAERLENRFAEDETALAQTLAVEDDLVDRYVAGKMSAHERKNFEQNYAVTPEKQNKIANARALHQFLEKQETRETVAEKVSFGKWLSDLFAAPLVWQTAAALLLLTFVAGTTILLFERARLNEQIADLQNQNPPHENDLQIQIEAAKQREIELQKRLENQNGQTGSLNAEIQTEREERERLETEVEKLRRQNRQQKPKNAPPVQPNAPEELANINLKPSASSQDTTTSAPALVKVPANAKNIRVNLNLPFTAEPTARYSVESGGKQLASNLVPKVDPSGAKILRFVYKPEVSTIEERQFTVKDKNGTIVSRYAFRLRQEQ